MRLAILARLFYWSQKLMRLLRRGFVAAVASALLAGVSPAASSGQNAARAVTDEVGRAITVPAEVKRIVSLAPNLTETVYALGLEDRLVGDTNSCDTPEAAKSKPHVGNPQNPDIEAIVALHPDLVLATTAGNRLETADALKNLGIPVYTSNPQSVLGMIQSTLHMADVMGASRRGAELAAQLRHRLDALHARLGERPMVHVLFIVWLEPLQSIGQSTFIADALRWAGAESVVTTNQSWPRISIEEVVRLQPEYIVFSQDDLGPGANEVSDLRARPVWRDLDAVQRGHVVNISEGIERPSPDLVDVIEQLARELHPEAFAASARHDSRLLSENFYVGAALKPASTGSLSIQDTATCAR
jgi:iron complex transport system substrate-binding protein